MKVFISHSSLDKPFVRTLKEDLKLNGFDTWLDEDELELGDNLVDRINRAIDETSHFIIVLSSNSINSNWVKHELEQAMSKNKSSLLQKVIPIVYRKCEIPVYLKDRLYHDLSNETVKANGNQIEFITDGYSDFLIKLRKSLSSKESSISPKERSVFKSTESSIKAVALVSANAKGFKYYNGIYRILKFRSAESRRSWIAEGNKLLTSNKISIQENTIILPFSWSRIFGNTLKTGDTIILNKGYSAGINARVVGYRKNDMAVTLNANARTTLGLEGGKVYRIDFSLEDKVLIFSSSI